MLSLHPHRLSRVRFAQAPAKQRGITLLISLIVLVAMTMAAISLMRSVDTTNVIAGNLAFRQSATASGDLGVEAAVLWLEQNLGPTLYINQPANGYSAVHQDPNPATNQTWDQWWNLVAVGRKVNLSAAAAGSATTGNNVSYTIDRMCGGPGDPLSPGANCAQTAATVNTGSSQTSGAGNLATTSQIYYRITSRTSGPHNTVSYVQAIIAL